MALEYFSQNRKAQTFYNKNHIDSRRFQNLLTGTIQIFGATPQPPPSPATFSEPPTFECLKIFGAPPQNLHPKPSYFMNVPHLERARLLVEGTALHESSLLSRGLSSLQDWCTTSQKSRLITDRQHGLPLLQDERDRQTHRDPRRTVWWRLSSRAWGLPAVLVMFSCSIASPSAQSRRTYRRLKAERKHKQCPVHRQCSERMTQTSRLFRLRVVHANLFVVRVTNVSPERKQLRQSEKPEA